MDRPTGFADLTREQLADVYTGKINNWKDLGGSDAPIVVVGRESGSGTRGAFEELRGWRTPANTAMSWTAPERLWQGGFHPRFHRLCVPGRAGRYGEGAESGGAEPTEENIKAGSYFLSRPFVMATKGDLSQQSELVQALLRLPSV